MTAATFKSLTPENLLDPDPLTTAFGHALDMASGELREMTRDEFLSYIFAPSLADAVPVEVRNLYEAGRAAMCYGYFFYRLFMLGFERSCTAAEAAVHHRARQLGATSRSSFSDRVDYLVSQGAISKADRPRWDAIRTIRDEAVHSKFQQVMPPGSCIEVLPVMAEAISRLFGSETD